MSEPSANPSSDLPSWLVGSKQPQVSLAKLLARFEQDPETTLVKVIGPVENPRTSVVVMSEDTAQRYQREFQDEYHFEKNAPLHPLSDPP